MIEALLYNVQVKALSKKRVEISLVPSRLGRWFKRHVRKGFAYRAKGRDYDDEYGDRVKGVMGWWWEATDRHVGWYVERNIEASPMLSIDDMTVEQLLLDDTTDRKDPAP